MLCLSPSSTIALIDTLGEANDEYVQEWKRNLQSRILVSYKVPFNNFYADYCLMNHNVYSLTQQGSLTTAASLCTPQPLMMS